MYDLFTYNYYQTVRIQAGKMIQSSTSPRKKKTLPKASSEGQLFLILRIGNPSTCCSLPQIQLVNGSIQMRHRHQHIHHICQFLEQKQLLPEHRIHGYVVYLPTSNICFFSKNQPPSCIRVPYHGSCMGPLSSYMGMESIESVT